MFLFEDKGALSMGLLDFYYDWKKKKQEEKERLGRIEMERLKIQEEMQKEALIACKEQVKQEMIRKEVEAITKPKKNFLNVMADEFKTMGSKAGDNMKGQFGNNQSNTGFKQQNQGDGQIPNSDRIAQMMGGSGRTNFNTKPLQKKGKMVLEDEPQGIDNQRLKGYL